MKVALIGYGAMGQLVSDKARAAGDEIGLVITSRDSSRSGDDLSKDLMGHDVVIEFSVAACVLKTVEACAQASVPLVEGTTGWSDQKDEVSRVITAHESALVYGANFSIGVNVFYRIVAQAASLFKAVPGYAPFIEEAHHARKRDAPSGTALHLRTLMNEQLGEEVLISSTRAGYIPGTHRVGFDSAADQITLTHTARSREGFAAGAVLAAHWIAGRKGVYEFSEVMDEIIKNNAGMSNE